jgi:hypothetical protein
VLYNGMNTISKKYPPLALVLKKTQKYKPFFLSPIVLAPQKKKKPHATPPQLTSLMH